MVIFGIYGKKVMVFLLCLRVLGDFLEKIKKIYCLGSTIEDLHRLISVV
jgi:hypothetical protein